MGARSTSEKAIRRDAGKPGLPNDVIDIDRRIERGFGSAEESIFSLNLKNLIFKIFS